MTNSRLFGSGVCLVIPRRLVRFQLLPQEGRILELVRIDQIIQPL